MFDDWWLNLKEGPGGSLDFLVYIGGYKAYHDCLSLRLAGNIACILTLFFSQHFHALSDHYS